MLDSKLRGSRPSFSCSLQLVALALAIGDLAGQCQPPPANLAHWWRGEGNVNDATGTQHGTIAGTPGYTNGRVGRAFTFDSDDDRVSIPHAATFNPTAVGFTVEFWMKATAPQPSGQPWSVVDKSHGFVDNTGWTFAGNPDGTFGITWGRGSDFAGVVNTTSLLDNTWHHIAGTWDSATLRLFIDGAQVASTPITVVANNTRPLLLGYASGGGTAQRFFRGSVDELAIYGRALSSVEISAIYSVGGAGKCTSASGVSFHATLDGAQEFPPTASQATATAILRLDQATNTVSVQGAYQGFTSIVQHAHLHAGPRGQNGSVLDIYAVSGGASGTFTGSTTLAAGRISELLAGNLYLNVHTTAFPGGEIRGQIEPSVTWNAASFAVGTAPLGIAILGARDLIVANSGSNTLTRLVNDGAGAFPTSVTVMLDSVQGKTPVAVAAGNLDTTGERNDVVVACIDASKIAKVRQAGEAGQVISYVGTLGKRPVAVACGDLDGDGTDDVVVACEGEVFAGGGGLEVILTGGLQTQYLAPKAVKVALCDFDGDGKLDIAVLAKSAPDFVKFYRNRGDTPRTFESAGFINLPTTGFATSLCCRDIDGDGDADLVVLSPDPFGPSNGFLVYANSGASPLSAANFTLVGTFPVAGSYAIDVASGDFENDSICVTGGGVFPGQSRKDVCVINGGLGAPVVNSGFSGGAFAGLSNPSAGTNPTGVVMADFNGDGCDDVAISNEGSDTVTVNLTRPSAIAQPFGTGCTGTSGVPLLAATGLPTSGNPALTITLANARAAAPTIVLFSVPTDGCAALLALPPSACVLYVQNPIVTVGPLLASGTGAASLSFSIPIGVPLGLDAFLQWLVIDPNGNYAQTASLSNALRLQVGI